MMPPAPPVSAWNEVLDRSRVDLGAGANQRLNDVCMILDRRQHQRGLPTEFLRRVHVRARLDEKLHGLEISRPRGQHQWRFALAVRRVGGCSGSEQGVDDWCAADGSGLMERRHSIAAGHIRFRTRRDQCLDRVEVVPMRRPLQRSRTVHVGGVDVGALFDQCLGGRRVLMLHRDDDACVRLRVHTGAETQRGNEARRGDQRSAHVTHRFGLSSGRTCPC